MIELIGASRWYGQVIGVNDITTEIKPGMTALLGQNGAGKSTLLKLITGQLKPTTGEVKVFGEAPFANPNVFRKLGYCPEIDQFYEMNTGREFVRFLAEISGLPSGEAKRRTDAVIEQVGMSDRADRKIAGYSKGMRQRIKLAQALLLDPEIIIMDEPLNGLDPVGRKEIMDLLHGFASEGKVVIISSHILYEVESLTRSILLLHRGRLLARGNVSVIREFMDRHPQKIRITTKDPRELAAKLSSLPQILSYAIDETLGEVNIQIRQPDAFYTAFNKLIADSDIQVETFDSPDNNLESVFSYLVNI